MLPGQRPRADHGGEGQHSQEGEEAQVQQALDAIIADASEGVQVVLEEERDSVRKEWGAARGLSLSLEAPLPLPGPGSLPLHTSYSH